MQSTQNIAVHLIDSNRYQPRLEFEPTLLKELAQSIEHNGLIQPISVRKNNNRYEIIAGERRFRAVSLLKWEHIPAFVMEVSDTQMAEMALVENIQREDLSAIEEAKAFQIMLDSHALTQEKIAHKMGKSQSSIANKMRLLQLPTEIQDSVSARVLTERHARALLGLEPELQKEIFQKIQSQHLNVRQTEALIENQKSLQNKKPKRGIRGITRSVQIAINTLLSSVKMIEKTGVKIELFQEQTEDGYEVRIRFVK